MERLPKRLEVTDMLAGLEVLGRHGVTAEGWNSWRKNDELVQQVAELIMELYERRILDMVFEVKVNWDRPLEDKVAQLRGMGLTYTNPDITSANFPNPSDKHGQETVKLVIPNFGKTLFTDQATQFLQDAGLTISHPQVLLDWLIQYYPQLEPFMVKGLYVAVLQTVWQNPSGFLRVVCLYCFDSYRELRLPWADGAWVGPWRFAGQQV